MRLHERLRRMIDGIPHGNSIMLRVEVVEEWLEGGARDVEPDLTVQQVAEFFDRKPQTVRTWIREGLLDAYVFRSNEYRITRRALEEFQSRERNGRNR